MINKSENKFFIKDIYSDNNLFEIEYYSPDECCCYFTVYEINGWDENGISTDKEEYLKCLIKWDGDAHFNFGVNGNGYLNLAGRQDFLNHANLMNVLFELAAKVIKNFDKDVSDYNVIPVIFSKK